MAVYDETLADTIGTNQVDTPTWRFPRAAADDIGVSYGVIDVRAQPALATDTMSVVDAIAVYRGVVVTERLRVALAQIPNHEFQLTLTDGPALNDRLLPAVPVLLEQGIGLALTQQAQQAINVIEELGLLPALAPALVYGRSVSEVIGLADSLARFFGGDIIDAINVAQVMSGSVGKGGQIEETIGLAAAASPRLLLRVTASDTVEIDDAEALRMLFSPAVADGVEIVAGYLSPGDSITTWAMNTRTAAVTEYSNYAFNSFARMGNKYLGASADGLYELVGDDDDGTDIIATIRSGFAQWAGSRFTMFKAAYLGVRGEGDFVLKLVTGDGKTYNYAVSARDMRSTKINIGKGIRTRYFAFELVSTGQDFDLDSIEFVPLVAQRRV